MQSEGSIGESHGETAALEAQRVGLHQLARWFLPWILAGVLVVIGLVGLWGASLAAETAGSEAGDMSGLGFATAGLALVALVWLLRAAFDGVSLALFVDDDTSLVVLVGVLAALTLGGMMVAARTGSHALQHAGYALAAASIVLIGANLKHYFDRRERRRAANDGAG